MESPLTVGVSIFAAWAFAALAAQILRTRAYGPSVYMAPAAGSVRLGLFYAFGPGMSPTAKESTRLHPGPYVLGMGYHMGVFASFALLILLLTGAGEDRLPMAGFRIFCLAGALCGVGLIVRRYASPSLRSLSHADDLISNLLTTGFAGAALARTMRESAEPAFLVAAMALLFYIPLGKIRHCFFFFSSRYQMGRFFGRRGTFPPRH